MVDWLAIAIIYTAGPIAPLTKRRNVAVACLGVLVVNDVLDPVWTLVLPKWAM